MDRTYSYLLRNFLSLFITMFLVLFFIASMTFLIKIASITSVIDVGMLEIVELFLYMMPKIIIYTVPATFFVALSITLRKLSDEKELLVLFSLGMSPAKIKNFFIKISLILSLMLVVDALLLIPISKQLYKNFIDYKKIETKLNISSSEFGQKFDDWFVFIKENNKGSYKDVILYSPNEKEYEGENIILAQNAHIVNQNGIINLKLSNGKSFSIKEDTIRQIDYEKLSIKNHIISKLSDYKTIFEYWSEIFQNKKIAKDFSIFLLMALFPVVSLLFAFSISITNARYASSHIYGYIFLIVSSYFLLSFILSDKIPLFSIAGVVGIYLIVSSYLYKINITSKF